TTQKVRRKGLALKKNRGILVVLDRGVEQPGSSSGS
ncbi:MAG: hypothetical protein RLY20_1336, partial [Verrucomicrobiota bacterium]